MASEQGAPKSSVPTVPVPNKLDKNKKFDIYPFYKSPDGEDCLEKTFYYTKYGAIGGGIFSFYEMVLNSKPSTVRACIARFLHFTGPAAAVGLTFGSTLCLVAQMRKKDDPYNHLVAGLAAGCIYGAKHRSYFTGHVSCIFLGFLAAYVKYFKINNIPIFPLRKKEHDYNHLNLDFTIKLYDDPGRPDRA